MPTMSEMMAESQFAAETQVKTGTANRIRQFCGGLVVLSALALWALPVNGWSGDEIVIKLVMSCTIALVGFALIKSED